MERRSKVNAVKEIAYRAGVNISFNPERFGEDLLNDLEVGLTHFLNRIPEEVRDFYEDLYIERYKEWLHALSNTFSVMITGGSNFNNKRHDKMNRYEQSARERFDKWVHNTVHRLNRVQRLTGWDEVERLEGKLERLQELQDKMKEANKIRRSKKMSDVEKFDELLGLGMNEKTANLVLQIGFASYQLTNNNAKIKDTQAAIERHKAMAQQEDIEYTFEGGSVSLDYSDERIRFYFDNKPSEEIRTELKGNAYKWSPRNGAWQRQLTPNALRATKRMIEKLNIKLSKV